MRLVKKDLLYNSYVCMIAFNVLHAVSSAISYIILLCSLYNCVCVSVRMSVGHVPDLSK